MRRTGGRNRHGRPSLPCSVLDSISPYLMLPEEEEIGHFHFTDVEGELQ